ncbi:MAG: hypothetical protein J1E64_09690 [Acetatifactor sp.]|nr:hypothetical protein [Acetatifactor sp.]
MPIFIEKYDECFAVEGAKRAALIYLDEDSIPELLILKDGEYRLYSFDGSEIKPIVMPDAGIHANAYGASHNFSLWEYQTFYWFEYVPYGGLARVHCGTDEERDDHYLRYTDGSFVTELEVKSDGFNVWDTYDADVQITNEEFLSRLSALGYDKLIPCGYLYEDVTTAYVNINAVLDNRKVLEAFVNGEIDALDYVEGMSDIPEESFVTRSYEEFFDDITTGEELWGRVVYTDFDNDGEEELVIRGFVGASLFFDVIGDTVYKVLETGTTTDVAYVAEFMGKTVIARTDTTHVGREVYDIMEFDSCCCLIDRFVLSTFYEGDTYTEDDEFSYRGQDITMEEFEKIRDNIN